MATCLVPAPRELFSQYDVDGSNGIRKEELGLLLEDLDGMDGVSARQRQEFLEKQFVLADLNGDHVISLDEFLMYYYAELCFKFPVRRNGFNPGAQLYNIFVAYCSLGRGGKRCEEMEGHQFAKMCKECKLMDPRMCTRAEVDIVFNHARSGRVCAKKRGAGKLQYHQFLDALLHVAAKRKTGFEEVVTKIIDFGGPKTQATAADFVVFRADDDRTYSVPCEPPKDLPPLAPMSSMQSAPAALVLSPKTATAAESAKSGVPSDATASASASPAKTEAPGTPAKMAGGHHAPSRKHSHRYGMGHVGADSEGDVMEEDLSEHDDDDDDDILDEVDGDDGKTSARSKQDNQKPGMTTDSKQADAASKDADGHKPQSSSEKDSKDASQAKDAAPSTAKTTDSAGSTASGATTSPAAAAGDAKQTAATASTGDAKLANPGDQSATTPSAPGASAATVPGPAVVYKKGEAFDVMDDAPAHVRTPPKSFEHLKNKTGGTPKLVFSETPSAQRVARSESDERVLRESFRKQWNFQSLGRVDLGRSGEAALNDSQILWNMRHMNQDDITMALKRVFERYNASNGGCDFARMDNIRFTSVLRDARLMGPGMRSQVVTSIFRKVVPSAESTINFIQFIEGLRHVATEKRLSLNEVIEAIVACAGPFSRVPA